MLSGHRILHGVRPPPITPRPERAGKRPRDMLRMSDTDEDMQERTATLETLWLRFRRDLMGFLVRRLPSKADAKDALQEVFLRIHAGASRLNEVENVEAWLYTIARRTVADHYRARGRRVTADPVLIDAANDVASVETAPPDNLSPYFGPHDVHEEVLSWLRPMIDELPEKYGRPLRMADVEGKTQQEVADALGLSLSGAKSRVQRARALLGDLLQRCCAVEFGEEGRAVSFQRLHPHDDPCRGGQCGREGGEEG